MAYRIVNNLLYGSKSTKIKPNGGLHLNIAALYHCSQRPHEESLPSEWYNKAYKKLTKLTHLLKNLDLIDGRLVTISDNTIVYDEHLEQNMRTFKELARVFIGGPSIQQALEEHAKGIPICLFSKPSEREPITVNSLTKVCNFLNISAQQRKDVRLTICPQVTQHQIWTRALEEILKGLESEMDGVDQKSSHSKGAIRMGRQIVVSCLKVLDTAISYDPESTSWMRLGPTKVADSVPALHHKWEDVLEMFNDLINCLRNEKEFLSHVTKLEVMKEGLAQIKDVLIDKSIGYKDIRYQESLVQKKLSKTLGHSSRCLFTLVNYYLYDSVRDIEVEVCGGVNMSGGDRNNNKNKNNDNKFCLSMGKILTSDDEMTVMSGAKELNKALGVFKFVWEAAGMKGDLQVQGHLWCVGSENRSFKYRENMFFLHGISL